MAKQRAKDGAKAARKAAKKPAKKPVKKPVAKAARKAAAPARQVERRTQQPQTLRVDKLVPSLTCDDLEKSLRFYGEGLGFHVEERWESEGKLLGVMLVAGSCELGLSQDDWAKGRDRQKGVGCRTWAQTAQKLEDLAERARAHGIAAEIKTESWGSRTLTVTDPDGFILTLHND